MDAKQPNANEVLRKARALWTNKLPPINETYQTNPDGTLTFEDERAQRVYEALIKIRSEAR